MWSVHDCSRVERRSFNGLRLSLYILHHSTIHRTLPEITHRVFFDVKDGDSRSYRIVVGLFGTIAPKAVDNFRTLARCDPGKTAPISGKPACYKGSTFHRVIPDFMIQGGDYTHGDGTGGESIFPEGRFEDESFELKFNRPMMLAMSNSGRDSNGSQFFITTVKTQWLDGKNVIFGMVLDGDKGIEKIEKTGTYGGKPKTVTKIVNCGETPLLPEDKEIHY